METRDSINNENNAIIFILLFLHRAHYMLIQHCEERYQQWQMKFKEVI